MLQASKENSCHVEFNPEYIEMNEVEMMSVSDEEEECDVSVLNYFINYN